MSIKVLKYLMMIGFMLSSGIASAAYLYWQVAPYKTDSNIVTEGGKYYLNGHEITKAQVKVSKDGGETFTGLTANEYDDGSWQGDYAEAEFDFVDNKSDLGGFRVNIGEEMQDEWKFYVELIGYDSRAYGDAEGVIGLGETLTYADLIASEYISYEASFPSVNVWTGGTYVVPEPTSALLLILGFGALGLKRRNERV